MKFEKYILRQVCNLVFRISFYAAATAFTLVIIFGNSSKIKQAFIQTDSYNRFVASIIDENVKKNNQTNDSLPLKDPTIQKIIKQSFPANTLQIDTETVIDSTYAWLNGVTPKPVFMINFTSNINTMADNLSKYAMARLKTQPICKVSQLTINPFTASCRPEFFDYSSQQIILANDIRANNGILSKTKLSINDLPKDNQGKTLIEQYAYAPRYFKLARYSPWFFGSLVLGSALVIIYMARRRREAINLVGTSMIGSSIFIMLSPLFFLYVFPRYFASFNAQISGSDGAVLGDVINKLSTDFNYQLLITGIVLAVCGVLIVLFEKSTRPKSKYVRVNKKAGLISSDAKRTTKGKLRMNILDIPIQTSEGERRTSKYQKDKRYRKIPKKEI